MVTIVSRERYLGENGAPLPLIGKISGSNGTSNTAVIGTLVIANTSKVSLPDIPADAVLFVSGNISGSSKSVFGGDVVISGTLAGGSPLKINSDIGLTGSIRIKDMGFVPDGAPGEAVLFASASAGSTKLFISYDGAVPEVISVSGSGGSAAGTEGQVQYNSGGGFAATSSLSWDATGESLSAKNISGSLTALTTGAPYIIASSSSDTSQTGSLSVTTSSLGQVVISSYVFPSNLTVSLSGGKTFGRYASGATIPAAGKTPAEVIKMAIVEPINPTVSLSSPTSVAFNQTAINNVLNFSYTINSAGASVSSVSLEWRRNNTGAWTVLSSDTSQTTFTHSLTDTNYNTQPFNYKYTVTDSVGATATATVNITPASYSAPSVSLTVAAVSSASPETNTKREKGNVSTNLSGTVTRNSANVALTSYTLQYQVNGSGAWTDIGSAVSIGPGTSTISLTNHNDAALKGSTSLVYRVKVIDDYQTSLSSFVTGGNTTVSFLNLIFYGPASSAPTDSAGVRALGSKIFTDGSNPFTLNTGNTQTNFTAAMPATLTMSAAIDLDALNASVLSSYILSTFNVNDAGGTAVSYNVYTMTVATPYASSHRHQITRA